MQAHSKASVTIAKPRETVFDFAISNDTFAATLLPYGPVPGVKKGEILGGQPLQKGATRLMTMSDGASIEEEILEHTRPSEHTYRWTTGIKPPFSWLVRSGTGKWDFTEEDRGTRVDWSYTFELSSALVGPLAKPIVGLFQRWQQRGLDRIKASMVGAG